MCAGFGLRRRALSATGTECAAGHVVVGDVCARDANADGIPEFLHNVTSTQGSECLVAGSVGCRASVRAGFADR
jgi:hypothetical protein